MAECIKSIAPDGMLHKIKDARHAAFDFDLIKSILLGRQSKIKSDTLAACGTPGMKAIGSRGTRKFYSGRISMPTPQRRCRQKQQRKQQKGGKEKESK